MIYVFESYINYSRHPRCGFLLMVILALVKKKSSVYGNEPNQKNPFEGKKVVFVENENEPENADGVRGHLEAVGESEHREDFKENSTLPTPVFRPMMVSIKMKRM